MKSKEPAKPKKQTVAVRDLKTKKNPKGGFIATVNWGDGSTPTGALAARAKPLGKS